MVIAGRQSYYLHFFRGQLVGVSRAQEIREQQFYYLVHTYNTRILKNILYILLYMCTMLHSFILYKHVYKTGTNRARIYWGTEKKKSQSKLKNRKAQKAKSLLHRHRRRHPPGSL